HRLRADHCQPSFPIGVEPRGEEMASKPIWKTHVKMREVAEMVEKCRPLAADFQRLGAGDRENHRQIVRREVPERVVLGMELAEPQPMRMDVSDFAEFPAVDKLLWLLEGGMEAQHMPDHEDALAGLSRRDRAFG